jgi:very-short-patch-repair endonuclease
MSTAAWSLVARQDDVIDRGQLLRLGFTRNAIEHRLATGRLRQLWPGVYAVGRREPTRRGWWWAALLRCGPIAVLSHESAAQLWGIRTSPLLPIHVSVPSGVRRRGRGIVVHRRKGLDATTAPRRNGIPVTGIAQTIVDVAAGYDSEQLERLIGDADALDLIDPETLRSEMEAFRGYPGARGLRKLLDRQMFVVTDTMLEQRLLPIADRAGLSEPQTQVWVNGFRVDFFWPELGLVVETDSLRYHRTAARQTRDRLRDQAHMAAGMTPLRFTRAQVWFEPDHVETVLAKVVERLRRERGAA